MWHIFHWNCWTFVLNAMRMFFPLYCLLCRLIAIVRKVRNGDFFKQTPLFHLWWFFVLWMHTSIECIIILLNAWLNVLISNRFICYEIRSDKHGARIWMFFFLEKNNHFSSSYALLFITPYILFLDILYNTVYIRLWKRNCPSVRWNPMNIFPLFAIHQMSFSNSIHTVIQLIWWNLLHRCVCWVTFNGFPNKDWWRKRQRERDVKTSIDSKCVKRETIQIV